MTFVVDVMAAVVGGLLLLVAASVISKRARWIMTAAVAQWLDVDLEIVFKDKDAAQEDLVRELECAATVAIFTGRGNELQRDAFDTLFQPSVTRSGPIRILLPQPDVELSVGCVDWIAQRENELKAFDPAYGKDLLRTQIKANVAFLQERVSSGQIQLRFYNAPHIGRIIITERAAYFTPYRAEAHGRRSRIYKFRRGDMYNNLSRLFEQLWVVNA